MKTEIFVFSRDSIMVIHECNVYKTGYLAASVTNVAKLVEMAQRGSFCKVSSLQIGWIGFILDLCRSNGYNDTFNAEKEVVRSLGPNNHFKEILSILSCLNDNANYIHAK